MTKRQERRYRRAAVANAKKLIGATYTLGGRFLSDPPHGDCRGLFETCWELAGAGAATGGRHDNVRAEYAWAKNNGCLLPPTAKLKPGDGIIYNEPGAAPTPANPLNIRHVAMCEYPPSPTNLRGTAISALNEKLGVLEHPIDKLHGEDGKPYAILGIFRPNPDLLDLSDGPNTDPEPPVPDQ